MCSDESKVQKVHRLFAVLWAIYQISDSVVLICNPIEALYWSVKAFASPDKILECLETFEFFALLPSSVRLGNASMVIFEREKYLFAPNPIGVMGPTRSVYINCYGFFAPFWGMRL